MPCVVLDKPHKWGELILATAGVVHAITFALPTNKRLEQELPPSCLFY